MTGAVPSSRPVTPASAARPESALSPERAALRKAAEGFEAIMVRKMLATARAANLSEQTPLTGGGLQQFQTMQDEIAALNALGAEHIHVRFSAKTAEGQIDSLKQFMELVA